MTKFFIPFMTGLFENDEEDLENDEEGLENDEEDLEKSDVSQPSLPCYFKIISQRLTGWLRLNI